METFFDDAKFPFEIEHHGSMHRTKWIHPQLAYLVMSITRHVCTEATSFFFFAFLATDMDVPDDGDS